MKLTDKGIEGVDEIEDIDISPKKEKIKQSFNNPGKNKIIIGKGTYIGLWIFAIIILLLFLTNIIWNNVVYTKKDYASNVNIPECPTCPELSCPKNPDCICNCNSTIINNIVNST